MGAPRSFAAGQRREGTAAAATMTTMTLRQWFASCRESGQLARQSPALLGRLAEAIDAAAGARVRGLSMDADRVVVECCDGDWTCRLPPAGPEDRVDEVPIQSRLASTLRQCLEPELSACRGAAAVRRLDVVLRRGEHEIAAARYGSCVEFVRAVGGELPIVCAGVPRRAPTAGVDESRGASAGGRRRTRELVVAGSILALALLVVGGVAAGVRWASRPPEVATEQPTWRMQVAEPPRNGGQNRDGKRAGSGRPGAEPAAGAGSEAMPTADDDGGAVGVAAEPIVPVGMPVADSRPPAVPVGAGPDAPPSSDRDGGSAPPVGCDDGRHGMPVAVQTGAGGVVSPVSLLAPCALGRAPGRPMMSPAGTVLTALGGESEEGGDWRRVAFRAGFQDGVCDLEEGVVRVCWTTREENLDGDTRIIRACGQLLRRSDGALLRDGLWLSWDEATQVLTVAEYDHGSCRRVTIYRAGVEETRSRDASDDDFTGPPSACSCVAFNGIDAVTDTVLRGVARNTAAIRASRRETAEAESWRVAVVQLHGMQEARAAAARAYAQQAQSLAGMGMMYAVCHPSREQMLGGYQGSGGAGSGGAGSGSWSSASSAGGPPSRPALPFAAMQMPAAPPARGPSPSPGVPPRLQP